MRLIYPFVLYESDIMTHNGYNNKDLFCKITSRNKTAT